MTKIVLYPTPVTLSKSVLWYIKRKRKKKKEKKERRKKRKKEERKERKKERKKEAAHIIRKKYSKTKLVKLTVPVNIQDNNSCIGAVV